jgi:uncharacterized membrane protein HdeD (DUF308 family)
MLVARGVLAFLFGIAALTLPIATAAALVLVFGVVAFADGAFAIASAIAGRHVTSDSWILLLHGAFGIGIGLFAFFNPAITAVALLMYVAAWAIVGGVLQVVAAVKLRHEVSGEWLLMLGGILSVAFGIALISRPGAGALALLWLIGTYALIWGVMLMIGGFDVRRLRRHVAA